MMIPNYQILHQVARSHAHVLIVPVRNECDRLPKLLQRMVQQQIHQMLDIIIMDGHSTDGTLQAMEPWQPYVTTILRQQDGPWGLGCQLRCAYSFALQAGYQGIVTIDGNDKDHPQAIPKFLQALEDGYHMVQGSRFIPGGQGQRTPWLRYLAIRWLHAPLLAWASGFPWTDTTQGFRAYSAKILQDDQVLPFRDCFQRYELLAYLSYRIPRLGYRCKEVPTQRSYPKGKIPTKIHGWASHLQLLVTLLKACRGDYNPGKSERNMSKIWPDPTQQSPSRSANSSSLADHPRQAL